MLIPRPDALMPRYDWNAVAETFGPLPSYRTSVVYGTCMAEQRAAVWLVALSKMLERHWE
jgi:hypothetical protein